MIAHDPPCKRCKRLGRNCFGNVDYACMPCCLQKTGCSLPNRRTKHNLEPPTKAKLRTLTKRAKRAREEEEAELKLSGSKVKPRKASPYPRGSSSRAKAPIIAVEDSPSPPPAKKRKQTGKEGASVSPASPNEQSGRPNI